jgi:hypothetical protein
VASVNACKGGSRYRIRNHSLCHPLLEVTSGWQKYYPIFLPCNCRTMPPIIYSSLLSFIVAAVWTEKMLPQVKMGLNV